MEARLTCRVSLARSADAVPFGKEELTTWRGIPKFSIARRRSGYVSLVCLLLFLSLSLLRSLRQPLRTLPPSSQASLRLTGVAAERSIPFLAPILYRFRLSALPLPLSAILSLFVPFTLHPSFHRLSPFLSQCPTVFILVTLSPPRCSPQCVTLSLIQHVVPVSHLYILAAFISQLPVSHGEYFLRSLVRICANFDLRVTGVTLSVCGLVLSID